MHLIEKNAVEKIGVINKGKITDQKSQNFKTSFLVQCLSFNPVCSVIVLEMT